MERLTTRASDSNGQKVASLSAAALGKDACRTVSPCSRQCQRDIIKSCDGCWYAKVLDRLAAYEDTGLTPEEVTERVTAVKPYAESRADRLCGACYSYIDWDALNDRIEDAPKYCKSCGKPIDWSDEKGGAE